MNPHRSLRARPLAGLGLAASGALALTLAAAGPVGAAPSASATVDDDVLTVVGRNGSESLALRLAAGDASTLQIDFGDDGSADRSFDRSDFSRIEVFLGNGADRFRVDQANGSFADEALVVHGGRGDDVLDGGDGNETFFGGSGDDAVDGNRGVDTGVLGSGVDSFRWDPGDGSDVVEGGTGFDTLDFNGAPGPEQMRLFAEGDAAIFFRAQGTIRMELQDVERLDLDALGGVDTVTVEDTAGTDLSVADIDLGVQGVGDAAADVVVVEGTGAPDTIDVALNAGRVEVLGLHTVTRISAPEQADRLDVRTGAGDDSVDIDAAVLDAITTTVDLGADEA